MPPSPPFPPPPSADLIAARVAALAPALNGAAWALDVKRSGSIAPFMTLMGAPWLIAQAVKASGEPAATRTFALSAEGLSDHIVATGIFANRSEATTWTWAPFMRPSPLGALPACLAIDGEGRLVMLSHNTAKAMLVSATMLPVERDAADSARDRLDILLSVVDAAGKVLLELRRVFTRARSGAA